MAATVLPIWSDGRVSLIREFKYAINRYSIEAMSGGAKLDETPEQAAVRELREELGLVAKVWQHVGCIDPFTTIVDGPNHMYLAKGLTFLGHNRDAEEEIEVIEVTLEEAARLVREGKITHSASCVLILRALELVVRDAGCVMSGRSLILV